MGNKEEKNIYFPEPMNFQLRPGRRYDIKFNNSLRKKYIIKCKFIFNF
ncbi:MAG: hypothetical protein MJ252_04275 [archaeon]|nr:hypothetical protein [archaeon]